MLSEKFVQKARSELREDENRKKQALEHFREWIAKHPYIKRIRQGNFDNFCRHFEFRINRNLQILA
jgi:hypothetical protein